MVRKPDQIIISSNNGRLQTWENIGREKDHSTGRNESKDLFSEHVRRPGIEKLFPVTKSTSQP